MKRDQETTTSHHLAELIAYLSLCMLAAAFGALLGPQWCRLWAIFGSFGLASAVGLDFLHRVRVRAEQQRRNAEAKRQMERNLNRVLNHLESSRAIRAAVAQLTQTAQGVEGRVVRQGAEPRWSLDRPVTITRLRRFSASPDNRLGELQAGSVRDISRHGIGLAHPDRLERGPLLVESEGKKGPPFRFVVDLLWCERQEDGRYFSGGKLIAVVSSETEEHPAPDSRKPQEPEPALNGR